MKTFQIIIDRRYPKSTYTIGNISLDDKWECNSLEDKDRGLRQDMSLAEIKKKKVYGETAIPKGTYEVRMDIVSPKYAAIPWYKELCGGRMPRIMDVPGFDGILFHPGTTALDTKGCVVVGLNKAKGKLLDSRISFAAFWKKLEKARLRGERIIVTIK